ncbi:TMEM175 family protein [Micromonospora foliorum]|uniref:TMEM175 family protein n=1 Tax=Micromonospora foliorum TaxID=2911210 RepID=UPI001EE7E2C1|nr:TMEM175 family protein [Micromonospora foliorum]MCG5440753.1 DUF1211 domain-containing protein [Micromonospora foliorum]
MLAFSDGVFAIAVTLLVLEIQPPHDFGNLVQGLGALWPSYLAYTFSTSLLADALRAEQGLRASVVVYGSTLWTAAALFNIVWAHLRRAELLDPGLGPFGARAIGRRFASLL